MLPRKPLASGPEPACPQSPAGFGMALHAPLCHPESRAGATLSPVGSDQVWSLSARGRPGFRWVGRFFADWPLRRGQSPAEARKFGSLPFRVPPHAVGSATIHPFARGHSPCVSPFLFLPLRPRPSAAAGQPIFSAPSLVPPPVPSLLMPRAARRWPVRRRVALPARFATTSTSAADPAPAGLTDSRLSFGPPMHAHGWSFHLCSVAAGGRPCSRKS